jgi:hypothetical protein
MPLLAVRIPVIYGVGGCQQMSPLDVEARCEPESGALRCISAAGEVGRALLGEGRDAFGIVARTPQFALYVTFNVELLGE